MDGAGFVGFGGDDPEPFEDADGPNVPIVPNVPEVSLPFFDDERDVLDADEWDDLETAAWLEQAPWSNLRGDDDPLDPFGS